VGLFDWLAPIDDDESNNGDEPGTSGEGADWFDDAVEADEYTVKIYEECALGVDLADTYVVAPNE
jgi:hypothetical protein